MFSHFGKRLSGGSEQHSHPTSDSTLYLILNSLCDDVHETMQSNNVVENLERYYQTRSPYDINVERIAGEQAS
jgi:hypothetical protein